jgi:hypothetical protein
MRVGTCLLSEFRIEVPKTRSASKNAVCMVAQRPMPKATRTPCWRRASGKEVVMWMHLTQPRAVAEPIVLDHRHVDIGFRYVLG